MNIYVYTLYMNIYVYTLYMNIYVYTLYKICVHRQYSFISTYLIKQNRHPLFIHFCIYPFKLLHQFYCIQLELVNKLPIIN